MITSFRTQVGFNQTISKSVHIQNWMLEHIWFAYLSIFHKVFFNTRCFYVNINRKFKHNLLNMINWCLYIYIYICIYTYIIPISTKQYWVVINKQKSSALGKQTPTDKYQMFMLKNFECPICTVTYVQRKKKN